MKACKLNSQGPSMIFISIGMAMAYIVTSIDNDNQILWVMENMVRFDMGSILLISKSGPFPVLWYSMIYLYFLSFPDTGFVRANQIVPHGWNTCLLINYGHTVPVLRQLLLTAIWSLGSWSALTSVKGHQAIILTKRQLHRKCSPHLSGILLGNSSSE